MKKEYKILLIAELIVNFGAGLIGPFYAVFVKGIGGTILDMGLTISLFSFTTGLLIILVGRISDKLDKSLVAVLGYYIYAFGTLGYLLVAKPWQLFLLQIVFAIGVACLAGPLTALFSQYIQKKKAGAQWGLAEGGGHMVVAVAVFLGTFVVKWWGFEALFVIMFFVQIMGAVVQNYFYLFTRKKKSKK